MQTLTKTTITLNFPTDLYLSFAVSTGWKSEYEEQVETPEELEASGLDPTFKIVQNNVTAEEHTKQIITDRISDILLKEGLKTIEKQEAEAKKTRIKGLEEILKTGISVA